jgi:hypothetical protein
MKLYFELKSELAKTKDDITELEHNVYGLLDVLKQINKEEMNSIRPGGSPSKSARISYEALKKFGAIE